uniref:F-box protein AT5G49610-like beta-propeller domain-containing protein n=1 Tax=Aegilops tauschii TaxID=37682 RepID=M8BF81_AEGTA
MLKFVHVFAKTLIRVYGPEDLQAPNEEETKKLMAMNETRGQSSILGSVDYIGYVFTPTLDPPDRIPAARFSLPQQRCRDERLAFVECRHGLALFLNKNRPEAVVWNPISGHQRRVAFPTEFGNTREMDILYAAVLCAAGDDDPCHVHGDCDLSSFKLALVRGGEDNASVSVCLYKSKSGLWGNVISATKDWYTLSSRRMHGVLVGNALYWWFIQVIEGVILEFDFEMQKLVVVEKPVDQGRRSGFQIVRKEESSLGLIMLTELTMRLWERKVNSDDVATWALQKTIDLTKHLWPRQSVQVFWTRIQGYDEDHNVIFLGTSSGSFMIQLDSMQFDNRFQFKSIFTHFPYTSFYAAEEVCSHRYYIWLYLHIPNLEAKASGLLRLHEYVMTGQLVVEMMELKCQAVHHLIVLSDKLP